MTGAPVRCIATPELMAYEAALRGHADKAALAELRKQARAGRHPEDDADRRQSAMGQVASVAAELGIADLLATGTKTVAELATATNTNEQAMTTVMRTLAGLGVFNETQPGTFELAELGELMRSPEEQEAKFVYMILAHVFMAVGMTLIYRRGREDKPWLGQGVRFGVLLAIYATIPIYLIYHAVAPYPMNLVVKQIAFDTVGVVLMGIVAAALNRD